MSRYRRVYAITDLKKGDRVRFEFSAPLSFPVVGIFVRRDADTGDPLIVAMHPEGNTLKRISSWLFVELLPRHAMQSLCENCLQEGHAHVNKRCLYAPTRYQPLG